MSTLLDALPDVAAVPNSSPVRSNPARRGPILLACDGNETSGAPVIAARILAERLHLPLEVVTGLEPQAIYAVARGGTPLYVSEVEDARRTCRSRTVEDYVARFSGGAAPVHVHARFGSIALEVADVARERNATFVITGAS